MRSGRLRHVVTLERRSLAKTSTGEEAATWTSLGTRRAAIQPLMGREFYAQSGEHSQITTRIRLRWDSLTKTLKPKDRLVDNSTSPQEIYDIEAIQNPDEKDRELVVMCKLWQSR